MREINEAGIALIKAFEGLHKKGPDGLIYPYADAVGYATIGFGHLLSKARPADLTKWPPITPALAEAMLVEEDLPKYAASVLRLVQVPLTDNQFAALTSFVFNLGAGALQCSTLLRLLNQARYEEAADQFLRWNMAGGRILSGLTRRRRAERDLFME
jgi:GH24 family phage-related lysozyme (muramidase)